MRKAVVFFVIGVVLFGTCSIQKADAQNTNIAQKIIGTWVDVNGNTWVFNVNGRLTRSDILDYESKFVITDTKLAIYNISLDRLSVFDISLSSDGKTLIISYLLNGNTVGNWLTRR